MTTENNEAKIITFGRIQVNSKCELEFSNFNIDGGDEFNDVAFNFQAVAILTLVIRRLQAELDKELANPRPVVFG